MRVSRLTAALVTMLLAVASATFAQNAPKVPWPAPDAWQPPPTHHTKKLSRELANGQKLLAHAKKVYVQSDLPPAFAALLPDWFTARYQVVAEPHDADLYVFVHSGLGGDTDPDVMFATPEGKPIQSHITTPAPPKPRDYDPCQHWPDYQSLPCFLSNLSGTLQPIDPPGPQTNWEFIHAAIVAHGQVDGQLDGQPRAKAAHKSAQEPPK